MYEHPYSIEFAMKYRQEELYKASGHYRRTVPMEERKTKKSSAIMVALGEALVSAGSRLKKRYEPICETGSCCTRMGCIASY